MELVGLIGWLVCLFVGWLVGRSVDRSVGRSVGQSVYTRISSITVTLKCSFVWLYGKNTLLPLTTTQKVISSCSSVCAFAGSV